jgi:hypothetical protein
MKLVIKNQNRHEQGRFSVMGKRSEFFNIQELMAKMSALGEHIFSTPSCVENGSTPDGSVIWFTLLWDKSYHTESFIRDLYASCKIE